MSATGNAMGIQRNGNQVPQSFFNQAKQYGQRISNTAHDLRKRASNVAHGPEQLEALVARVTRLEDTVKSFLNKYPITNTILSPFVGTRKNAGVRVYKYNGKLMIKVKRNQKTCKYQFVKLNRSKVVMIDKYVYLPHETNSVKNGGMIINGVIRS
jgi:hypothetical protein